MVSRVDILIDPTEDPPFSELGQPSKWVQELGVDALWSSPLGLAGCQRKTVSDLVGSARNPHAHLGVQFKDMVKNLAHAFLIVEGTPAFDREGNWMSQYARWTVKEHEGVYLRAQSMGVLVLTSRSALDTCRVVEHLYEWTQKEDAVSSLLTRSKAQANGWGQIDDRSTFIHIFSAVGGVSTEMCGRIFDELGNILTLKVTEEELKRVKGLGPKRIASIMKTFSSAGRVVS